MIENFRKREGSDIDYLHFRNHTHPRRPHLGGGLVARILDIGDLLTIVFHTALPLSTQIERGRKISHAGNYAK